MKNWIQNLALAGAAFALLLLMIYLGLGTYTRHGEEIQVPSVTGLMPEKAREALNELNLTMSINDSQYIPEKKPGIIISQLPLAKEKVKEGRVLYLTINTLAKPTVRMPSLIDQSLTLSKALLKSRGLKLGHVGYQFSSEGNNLVLGQFHNGQPIETGTSLSIGSKIDLLVIKVVQTSIDSAGNDVANPN